MFLVPGIEGWMNMCSGRVRKPEERAWIVTYFWEGFGGGSEVVDIFVLFLFFG